jgi:hypothetical protein
MGSSVQTQVSCPQLYHAIGLLTNPTFRGIGRPFWRFAKPAGTDLDLHPRLPPALAVRVGQGNPLGPAAFVPDALQNAADISVTAGMTTSGIDFTVGPDQGYMPELHTQ